MTDDRPDAERPDDPPTQRGSLGRMRDRFFGLTPRPAADEKRPGRLSPEQLQLATAGLELGGGILVFAAIGYGLDRLLGTWPVLLVTFALLGLAGGLYRLIKAVQPPDK
ncbi:MAG: AtpZ/AtpI family protein [Planctomycetota bacterium]